MSKLETLAERAIKENNMLRNGDSVIVALSGGADSVSLFTLLNSIKEKYNLTIYAAHLNHNLRGEEAERDENFVKILCEKNNVELYIKSVDINALAAEQKISTELCGRNQRYAFFSELSQKLGAKVATAHTASDNAETVLFNLIRGSGINGLGGIRPIRGNIIRPLIYAAREDVEEYCEEKKLSYVTDSTNLTDDYTRNLIRHKLVPVCRTINPSFEQTVSANSEVFNNINSFLELKTEQNLKLAEISDGYSRDFLLSLEKAELDEVVYILLKKYNIEPQSKLIRLTANAIRDNSAVDLSQSTRAVCKQGVFRIINSREMEYFSDKELKNSLAFEYNDKYYSFTELKSTDKNIILRTRRGGDKFTLAKRGVTKTVKKLLNELKIPEEKRDSLLLLAEGSTVLWLENVGFSKQGKELENIIEITIRERGTYYA